MTRTPRKPALTARAADLLRALSAYASSEAGMLRDGPPDQVAFGKEIQEACEWIDRLAAWHDAKQKGKEPS